MTRPGGGIWPAGRAQTGPPQAGPPAAAPPRAAPAPGPDVVRWADGAAWDAFVAAAADSTLAHRWGWLDVVAATYRHPVLPLAATRRGALVGVLPLVLVRSRVFGRRLVSMPYLDYGGLCTAGDADADRALVTAALELAARHRAPLELRHLTDREIGLPVALEKVTLTLDLAGGEDAAWARIKSNRRGQVRKARRNGLTTEVLGEEGLRDYYRVWATNMRDLGSPPHPRAFFGRMLAAFGTDARVILVRDGADAVGAGILLRHGERIVLPWSSSLRSSFAKGPNQLLYWEAIRHGIETGARVFDFGRSSVDSGTFESKREWGAQPVQLYWHHHPAQAGSGSSIDRLAWATKVWQRLPVGVATAVGARIRGGIAN